MHGNRGLLTLSLLALSLSLGGCETFEDWFSTKKPLPGERRAVFPTGVPGVPQGVPPELVQGYQPPPEPEPQVVEAPERPKPKPRPPRPRQVAAPTQPAAEEPLQPARRAPRPAAAQPAAQSAPWPEPRQTASQPAPAPNRSPFPDPPPPGTFAR